MLATVSCSSTYSHSGINPAPMLSNPVDLHDDCIQRAKNGNLEAFNQLVLTYQDRVFRQALWMLNDEAEAEDITQEVFLQAYCKIHTFQQGNSFRPWLLKITTNRCLDRLRMVKRRPCQPLMPVNDDEEFEPKWLRDPGDTPEAALERSEIQGRIYHAMQHLTLEYRMTLILVDLQELEYAEACAILHIPMGTLKSRLARARAKVREEIINFLA